MEGTFGSHFRSKSFFLSLDRELHLILPNLDLDLTFPFPFVSSSELALIYLGIDINVDLICSKFSEFSDVWVNLDSISPCDLLSYQSEIFHSLIFYIGEEIRTTLTLCVK